MKIGAFATFMSPLATPQMISEFGRRAENMGLDSILDGRTGLYCLSLQGCTKTLEALRRSSRTAIQSGRKAMACEDLITACFLNDDAPLAVPDLNRERTLKYLECCYRCGMSWEDVEQQIENFLQQRGVPREGIVRQLKLAKPLLRPWLE